MTVFGLCFLPSGENLLGRGVPVLRQISPPEGGGVPGLRQYSPPGGNGRPGAAAFPFCGKFLRLTGTAGRAVFPFCGKILRRAGTAGRAWGGVPVLRQYSPPGGNGRPGAAAFPFCGKFLRLAGTADRGRRRSRSVAKFSAWGDRGRRRSRSVAKFSAWRERPTGGGGVPVLWQNSPPGGNGRPGAGALFPFCGKFLRVEGTAADLNAATAGVTPMLENLSLGGRSWKGHGSATIERFGRNPVEIGALGFGHHTPRRPQS